MKLQLIKSNDGMEGYISMLDNYDNELVCKPVSGYEFDGILSDFLNSTSYSMEEKIIEGWTNLAHIVEDLRTPAETSTY